MSIHIGDSLGNAVGLILLWLPKLLSAIAILIIGYIVAKIIKAIITKALRAARLDHLLNVSPIGGYLERVTTSPARTVGTVVYWLIYLGVVSLAVSVLGIPALTAFIAAIYGYLPNVVAAVLIFLIAAGISAGIAGLAVKLMGDTPTGKLMASVLPTLTMVIAVFMILDQLKIAPAIVNITYAGLVATMVLGVGLSVGLGGREVASDAIGEAYRKGKANTDRVKQDIQAGKARAQQHADDIRE